MPFCIPYQHQFRSHIQQHVRLESLPSPGLRGDLETILQWYQTFSPFSVGLWIWDPVVLEVPRTGPWFSIGLESELKSSESWEQKAETSQLCLNESPGQRSIISLCHRHGQVRPLCCPLWHPANLPSDCPYLVSALLESFYPHLLLLPTLADESFH